MEIGVLSFKKKCVGGERGIYHRKMNYPLTLSFSCLFICSAFIKLICNNCKDKLLRNLETNIIYSLAREGKESKSKKTT